MFQATIRRRANALRSPDVWMAIMKNLEVSTPIKRPRGAPRASAIGERYGALTIIGTSDRRSGGHVYWICRCDCGTEKEINGLHLRIGKVKSCGCGPNKGSMTHGMSRTPEYSAWSKMIQRCHNENSKDFHDYGGRGIAVCKEWRESFSAFLSDMGGRPSPELTLERVDNNQGYSKDNCKWATWSEQAFNRRPKSRWPSAPSSPDIRRIR